MQLVSTGVVSGASGKADFESRPGRTDFSVEIEDLPLGVYSLNIGGIARGSITVVDTVNGPEGEIEFRSPPEPGKELLDFDPRGQIIEVLQGSTVVLESIAPDSGDIPGSDQGNPPPFGDSEIEVSLVNAGVSRPAPAMRSSSRSPIESISTSKSRTCPWAATRLPSAVSSAAPSRSWIRSTAPRANWNSVFPAEPGKLPLDFDPRGQLIEVSDASGLVFSVNFPSTGGAMTTIPVETTMVVTTTVPVETTVPATMTPATMTSDPGEIQVSLNNAGVFPAASGDARYRIDDDGDRDFDVEIEDLPVGGYDLVVGGVQRGTIGRRDDDGNEGEIEFGNPADDDELPLDFDPRGELIEIFDGGTLIFSVNFPS